MMDNALKYAKDCRNKMQVKYKNDMIVSNKKIYNIVNKSKIDIIKKMQSAAINAHSVKKFDFESLKKRVSIIADKTKQFIGGKFLDKFDEQKKLKKRFQSRAKFVGNLSNQVSQNILNKFDYPKTYKNLLERNSGHAMNKIQ